MKTLQAFLSTEGRQMATSDGARFKLLGDATFDIDGCGGALELAILHERISVSAIGMSRGQTSFLRRPGRRDHRFTAPTDGVLFMAPIPDRSESLALPRRERMRLHVDLEPSSGCWRDSREGPIYLATTARIQGVHLARQGNCEVTILDLISSFEII